jgi:hypothetical protein
MRNRVLGLRHDALITSVTLFTIRRIIAAASLVACCTIAFASFPSGHISFNHDVINVKI